MHATSVKKVVNRQFANVVVVLFTPLTLLCIVYCSECSKNPQEAIESRVGTLGETFLREYVQVMTEFLPYLIAITCFSITFYGYSKHPQIRTPGLRTSG